MEVLYIGKGLGGAACMGGSVGADANVDAGAGMGAGSTGAVVTVGDGTAG